MEKSVDSVNNAGSEEGVDKPSMPSGGGLTHCESVVDTSQKNRVAPIPPSTSLFIFKADNRSELFNYCFRFTGTIDKD